MKLFKIVLITLPFALLSCKREQDEIKVYQVSKEAASQDSGQADPHAGMPAMGTGGDPHAGIPGAPGGGDPHAGMPGMGGAAGASAPTVTDEAPAHWEKQPGSSIRALTYLIKGGNNADAGVTLSRMPASPASRLSGVNMWREQVGQAPLDAGALEGLPALDTPFGKAVLVEVEGNGPSAAAGNSPKRLVGMIAEKDGMAWYFKLVGDAALVAKEKDIFLKWAGTVKAAAPAPQTAPPAPAGAETGPAPGEEQLSWTIPSGWQPVAKARMGGYASFAAGGEGQVVVTHFPGDVGGDVANVNRWRTQAGMTGEVTAEQLPTLVTSVTAGPKTLKFVDCKGPTKRMVVAWVRHGADTWFFRLTGPDAAVTAELAKFTAFVESVRFTKPE